MTHYQAYDKSSYSFYKIQIRAYLDNARVLGSWVIGALGFPGKDTAQP